MRLIVGLILAGMVTIGTGNEYQFHEPKVLTSNGKPIELDSPGYAAPCWADINGDGKEELLVGQFANGHIAIYEHQGDLTFGGRTWLEANGKVAKIPGVW